MGAATLPVGRAKKTIDRRGRLPLPAGQARALGQKVYLSPSLGRFIQVYGEDRWNSYVGRLADAVECAAPELRAPLRHLLGQAVETHIDDQNRLVIPHDLITLSELFPDSQAESRDVIVVGTGICVEIWDPARLAEHEAHEKTQLTEMWSAIGALLGAPRPAAPAATRGDEPQ